MEANPTTRPALPWTRTDWLNLLLFATLVLLFFWRIITPNPADQQSFPPGDFSHQFWAFATLEVRELYAGRLPLWNPYTYSGAPFWADVQAAVFYPPSLLTILLSAPWGFSLFALQLEAIAHFWLAACFMYLLTRQLTHSRAAAATAAVTFTFSGYLTGYPSQQLAVLEADIWLPLILYFLTRHRPLAAGVALGLSLLAGHPQSGFIVATLSLSYLIFRTWPHYKTLLHHTLRLITTALGLAAIQFIPAVEYTLHSVRAAGTYPEMSGGFPLIDLLQLLLPGLLSHYSPLYLSLMGLMLALCAIFNPHPAQKETTFWATVAGLTLLISFGGNTFLYSPLYLTVPGFSIFRGQERWAFATAISLSILSGYGHALLIQKSAPLILMGRRLSQYLLGGGLLLMALAFYGLNDSGWTPDNPFYELLNVATFATLLLGLIFLLWRFVRSLTPPLLTALTMLLITFDLFTINWQTNLYPQPPEWHTQIPTTAQAIQADAAATSQPFRVYNEFRLYDNYGIPAQLEDLWGASPLRPARYAEFLAPPMPIERAWELLNVKYVITWRETLYLPSTIIHQETAADSTTYVHRLAEEAQGPRAWLVYHAEVADDATMLQTLADPTFNRWQTALLEPTAAEVAAMFNQPQAPLTAGHVISRTMHHPAHLSYHVTTTAPALLILSEPSYPGWYATVNGQHMPLVRANYILRALPLPPGPATIELTFQPGSFYLGTLISGLTLVGLTLARIRRNTRLEQFYRDLKK